MLASLLVQLDRADGCQFHGQVWTGGPVVAPVVISRQEFSGDPLGFCKERKYDISALDMEKLFLPHPCNLSSRSYYMYSMLLGK